MQDLTYRDDAQVMEAGSKVGIGWWAFTILASAQFTYRYVLLNGFFIDLVAYAHGRERMPYQGRILMAWILNGLADNPHLLGTFKVLCGALPISIRDPYHLVMLLTTFISILGAIVAGRFLLEELTLDSRFSAWAALLTLYMTYFNLIVGYGLYGLPYDIPSLTAFMTAMWLIVSNRRWWLLLVVALGSLNRETVIVVPIIFLLYAWFSLQRRPLSQESRLYRLLPVLPSFFLQIVVWSGIRLWVNHTFRNNPTDVAVFYTSSLGHLRSNIVSLMKPPQWPLFLSLFGFTVPLLVSRYRLITDVALRLTSLVVLTLWLSVMLVEGVIVEIRVFNEMTALVMPCVALIIWNGIRGTDRGRDCEANFGQAR